MVCPICGSAVEAVAENSLENWLRHHFRRLRTGDGAHLIAMVAVPLMVAWAAPKLRRAL